MPNIIDPTLGIQSAASDVLKHLTRLTKGMTGGRFTSTRTSAWYNGRERGVVIDSHKHALRGKNTLFIAFSEFRRSDQIVVYSWMGESTLNPPTTADFTEEAYKSGVFFDYDKAGDGAEFVFRLLSDFAGSSVLAPE